MSYPSEHTIGINLHMTIIKLSPGEKVLEQLSYYFFFKQNKFFYMGKFYSSKKKTSGMGPAKSALTISEIKDEPG